MIVTLLFQGCTVDSSEENDSSSNNTEEDLLLQRGSYETMNASIDEQSLEQFSTEEEFSTFMSKYHRDSSNQYFVSDRQGVALESNSAQIVDSSGSVSDNSNRDYSKTNNQEQEVDEADIIKTNGEYIYTITDNTVFIIKSYPAKEGEVVSTIKFNSTPDSLFLHEDTLAVFGQTNELEELREADISPTSSASFLKTYDVSEPSSISAEESFIFEGRYENGRMIDGIVYLGVVSSPEIRDTPMPYYIAEGSRQHISLDSIHYYDVPYRNPSLATIHSISLDQGKHLDAVTVTIEYGQELYMSKNNIYLAYEKTVDEYDLQMSIMEDILKEELSSRDEKIIKKIKQTDDQVLSRSEKQQKIRQIYQSYLHSMDRDKQNKLEEKAEKSLKKRLEDMEHLQYSMIHRISVDNGELNVMANGKIPGRINNQFSMDEYENTLRVATTLDARWSSVTEERSLSTNNVYTLDEELNIMDSLENLAENEEIYSTRFVDNKLYMVTFRQIDPFFVIDLSNPQEIVNEGELKITGFSRYLHPYDENTIIGIGKAATKEGRSLGVKISLFDVSDVNNPKEIASYTTKSNYSNSNVLYEHKAFLFDREKNLLAFPAHSYKRRFFASQGDKSEGEQYNGALVFNITKEDISLRGLIDHSSAGNSRYNRVSVERSLFIENMLYTKSENLLRINNLNDLQGVKNITLNTKKKSDDIPIY